MLWSLAVVVPHNLKQNATSAIENRTIVPGLVLDIAFPCGAPASRGPPLDRGTHYRVWGGRPKESVSAAERSARPAYMGRAAAERNPTL